MTSKLKKSERRRLIIQILLVLLGSVLTFLSSLAWKFVDGLSNIGKNTLTEHEYARTAGAIFAFTVFFVLLLLGIVIVLITQTMSPLYDDTAAPIHEVIYTTSDGQGEQYFYQLLEERVGAAKTSIRTVSLPRKGSLEPSVHRRAYYDKLDRKLLALSRAHKKFTLARIVQVGSPGEAIDPEELDELIRLSCETMLKSSRPDVNDYDLFALKTGSVATSFFVIDDQEVILLAPRMLSEDIAQNQDDTSFMGFAVHVSRDPDFVNSFVKLFTKLRDSSIRVKSFKQGMANNTRVQQRASKMLDKALTDMSNLIDDYNKAQKSRYCRGVWRNLTLDDVASHPALGKHILKWGCDSSITSEVRSSAYALDLLASTSPGEPSVNVHLPANDASLEIISAALLNDELVIIPNGHIYVIFGLANDAVKQKINNAKLRDPNQELVYLGFDDDDVLRNITAGGLKNLVKDLLANKPIGFRLASGGGATEVIVFYKDEFVEKLQKQLSSKDKDARLFVSSANLTTMGSTSDLNTVLRDFSQIVKNVVKGDNMDALQNQSTTILDVSNKMSATYYRIGYPSQATIDDIARKHNMYVQKTNRTRMSDSQD